LIFGTEKCIRNLWPARASLAAAAAATTESSLEAAAATYETLHAAASTESPLAAAIAESILAATLTDPSLIKTIVFEPLLQYLSAEQTANVASSFNKGQWNFERLTRTNFPIWRELMLLLIKAEETSETLDVSYVNGTKAVLEETIMTTLKLRVDPSLLLLLRGSNHPKQAWKVLHDTFASQTETSKVIARNNFNEQKLKSGQTMLEYLQTKDILGENVRLSVTEISEAHMLASYHSGLKDSKDFRAYSKATLEKVGMTVQAMRAALLEEWDEQHPEEDTSGETGFNTQTQYAGNRNMRRCFICSSTEHLKNNCPKLKQEERARPQSNSKFCSFCNRPNHSREECRTRMSKEQRQGSNQRRDNRGGGRGDYAKSTRIVKIDEMEKRKRCKKLPRYGELSKRKKLPRYGSSTLSLALGLATLLRRQLVCSVILRDIDHWIVSCISYLARLPHHSNRVCL
jgi:hypothetical protein